MSRRPWLVISALALAVASAWIVTRGAATDEGGAEAGRADASTRSDSNAAGSLATPADRRSQRVGESSWSVTVVGERGQRVPAAELRASLRDLELVATGSADWVDVAPGTWQLTVTAAGAPTWEREVLIEAGATTRTIVELFPKIRVTGEVVNTWGEPLAEYFVAFVANDDDVPETLAEARAIPFALSNREGRFELLLPGAGPWRTIVFRGGGVVFEERPAGFVRPVDRDHVRIVLPAGARLDLHVDPLAANADGTTSRVPRAVSIYREPEYDGEHLGRRAREAFRASAGTETPEQVDDENRAEHEAAAAAEAEANGSPEEFERRRAFVPPGWVLARTSLVPPGGRVRFGDLPVDAPLKFAIRVGAQVYLVDPFVYVPEESKVRLDVDLPEPGAVPPGDPQPPGNPFVAIDAIATTLDIPADGLSSVGAWWE